MSVPKYSAKQQVMVDLWEQHMASEFQTQDTEATMATMTSNPFVNHVPVMTGGVGVDQVRKFYSSAFITRHAPDTTIEPVARTVGADRIVDEIVYKCTHTIAMPWMLPGIAPTGKRIEVAIIVVVQFDSGKIAGERIYWDQATVLAQLGLIDPKKLPVTGAESSRKVADPSSEPSNKLIDRAK